MTMDNVGQHEDHRAFAFSFRFVEVDFAVFQLRDANGDGLGPLTRQFLDFLEFFAELSRILNFGDDLFGDFLVPIEKVQQLFANAVDQIRSDFSIAELVFCL